MTNPTILWAQDRYSIFVTFEIIDLQQHDISFESNKILLKGSNKEQDFDLEVELNSDINAEKSSWQIKSNCIKMTLQKEITKFWNRLTKVKQNNVKIDWQKWVNEDDSDDSDVSEPLLNDFADFKKTLPSELLEKDFSELLPEENTLDLDLEDGFEAGAEETSESYEESRINLNSNNETKLNIEELNTDKLERDITSEIEKENENESNDMSSGDEDEEKKMETEDLVLED